LCLNTPMGSGIRLAFSLYNGMIMDQGTNRGKAK
jgi:hypothetical protein